MRHAVIMAGGSGTRLWPLSRRMRPKQLMKLFDGKSLLQLACERLSGVFEPQNTWVITSAAYIDLVATELPQLPRTNLIGEPMGRDTANAIGLAASLLARRDPQGSMAVFTADHLIEPVDVFAKSIRTGLDAAERFSGALVTFGITPDSPQTGYGYVQRGPRVATDISNGGQDARATHVYEAADFKEKPTLEVAKSYLASGDYFWNSGMFAWSVPAILAEMRRQLPENAATLGELAATWDEQHATPACAAKFESLKKISIDYGIMENAQRVLLVEMPCKWRDLGSWSSIGATRPADERGNVTVGKNGIAVGGANNILVSESDHLIMTLGVDDIVVIHSDNATLVCRRDQEQAIRDLAVVRKERFGDRYE